MSSPDHVVILTPLSATGSNPPAAACTPPRSWRWPRRWSNSVSTSSRPDSPSPLPGDFEAVRAIAREFGDRARICGLARSRDEDIDRAWEALKEAKRSRIHVFLATSSIHRQHKLRMEKGEIVRRAVEAVKRAKGYVEDVEFSPEDAARTEHDFLAEVVERAIEAEPPRSTSPTPSATRPPSSISTPSPTSANTSPTSTRR